MAIANAFNRRGGTGPDSSGSFDGTIKEVTFTDQTSLTITHDFENIPSVIIIDSSGYLVHAEVQHTSSSQILINFSDSLSGTVIIR
tara:strand:- start:5392 stop:5649 length:258 start_codon:yes stop_codon:yes gene_type:complete